MSDLSNYRKSYEKSELREDSIPDDPILLFAEWFKETENSGSAEEVNAMNIATFGLDGFPKSRIVLLKEFNSDGFIFYTNYNSEKGKAIAQNPNVCLSFFWHTMERQVIIKGIAQKTSDEVSTAYFESRPVGSQLGAAVSNQSDVIKSREVLETELARLQTEFDDVQIPRPKNWGGYLIRPIEIEFWQGRRNRLHDRIRYQKQDRQTWKAERLAP